MEVKLIQIILGMGVSVFLALVYYMVRAKDKRFDQLVIEIVKLKDQIIALEKNFIAIDYMIESSKLVSSTLDDCKQNNKNLKKDVDVFFERLRKVELRLASKGGNA